MLSIDDFRPRKVPANPGARTVGLVGICDERFVRKPGETTFEAVKRYYCERAHDAFTPSSVASEIGATLGRVYSAIRELVASERLFRFDVDDTALGRKPVRYKWAGR